MIIKTIAYPFLIPFKMGAVILQGMYFFAGWLIIALGYLCSIVAVAVGICAVLIGLWNITNEIGALLLGIGCGWLILGLAAPFFYGTNYMMQKIIETGKAVKKAYQKEYMDKSKLKGNLLKVSVILLIAGTSVGGLGVLFGGIDSIALPGILLLMIGL